jgi:hypothetical protein
MADNFDMKKFLVENKLGAYSRLKEATNFSEPWKYEFVKDGDDCIKINPETGTRSKVHHTYCKRTQNEMETKVEENQLNEYEITYEYGSDGSCYRVDDEGNYDEVDDSYCRRYAGQGVREEKEKTKEDIGGDIGDAEAEKMMDFLAEKEKDEVKESLDDEDAGGIETDIEMDLAYAENPIVYLKSIIDFCTKKIKEIEQNGSEDSEMQETKKEEIKEALSPEAFERMDAIASNTAQIAMIKAAEIMMNQLTEEGFEVLDIREYFTQLIANDI